MSPDPPDTVQIVITSRLPDVISDRVRIYQVFQNLIANAISVMDTPQGIIRIEAQDAGASWRFSVADNGPGIEPQHYEHIFKIFHTIDSSVERDSNGIGLALVKKNRRIARRQSMGRINSRRREHLFLYLTKA